MISMRLLYILNVLLAGDNCSPWLTTCSWNAYACLSTNLRSRESSTESRIAAFFITSTCSMRVTITDNAITFWLSVRSRPSRPMNRLPFNGAMRAMKGWGLLPAWVNNLLMCVLRRQTFHADSQLPVSLAKLCRAGLVAWRSMCLTLPLPLPVACCVAIVPYPGYW